MFKIDQDDGWTIDSRHNLISHNCGFEAEYKGNEIYGIKQFPIDATVIDIRNMVSRAEEILSDAEFQNLRLICNSKAG
jgi:hypothetical protein